MTAAECAALFMAVAGLELSAAEARYVVARCGAGFDEGDGAGSGSESGAGAWAGGGGPGLESAAPLHLIVLFLARYLV